MALPSQLQAAEVLVSDTFEVESSRPGFALDSGINTGITATKTRMTGSVAKGLRYIQTSTGRTADSYDIENGRLRVKPGKNIGRFTLSDDGKTAFDFGPALKTDFATKGSKAVYELKISMRNEAKTESRFSFGLATKEGDISNMDFALQLYRHQKNDNFYTIRKRFDRGSINGNSSADREGDLHAVMATTPKNSLGKTIDFLIRVTDAGAEGSFAFNSRIQVSLDHGSTWIYDTANDSSLPNGFRLDGTSRYLIFDQAINNSGAVYYDNLAVTLITAP